MANWNKIKRELIGNKILISSFLFIFFYALYILIPMTESNRILLWTFYWFILYMIGFCYAVFLYQETYIITEKFGCFLIAVYMGCMGTFNCFICNKDLPTYIAACNSWLGGIIALTAVLLISFVGFIFLSLDDD
jgi:hypothetical protein